MRLSRLLALLAGVTLIAACDDGTGGTASPRQEAPRPDAGAAPADAAAPVDARVDAAVDAALDAALDAAVDLGPPPSVAECFQQFGGAVGPQYAPFDPVLGHHCLGTNHQDIQGVERVVFLGTR
ncbi:MAG: hypothetical protein R3F43_05170 [bacterium]